MIKRLLLPLWILVAIALFLYSFTQVDLSLTFSSAGIFQTVQKYFQYVGWFNRPLSTYIYVGILVAIFALYGITLHLINTKKIERKKLLTIVFAVTAVLFLSYCAFSYDIFNYIFDAKIITHYNQNPYEHKALDYAGDPMLSFMRWTHRVYPYGPFWLVLTVPLSYVGFGIFSFTFYLFKLLMLASFVGTVLLIERLAKKLDFDPLFAVAAFALNPLVLVESLVSSHNDIVMMFFGLLAIYLFYEKRYITSYFSLLFSILIKFATVLEIPAILAKSIFKLKDEKFFYLLILCMIGGALLATFRTQFQPWYLIYPLTFAAFVQKKYFIAIPVFIISIAALMQYIPYLYLGNWDPPVPFILNSIMLASVVLSVIVIGGYKLIRR